MDLELSLSDHADLEAPAYALLLATIPCWECRSVTPTAALWVPNYVEHDEEGEPYPGDGAAVLHYIQGLDAGTFVHLRQVAPWLRPASTQMSGMRYLAHHCGSCNAVQGDHFVFGPDGPYFPQDDAAIAAFQVVPGVGALRAVATVGGSGWMDRVSASKKKLSP